MDLTIEEEWKSMFPICAVFNHPLLLSGPLTKPFLGPLLFNPLPISLTRLFSSPSFLPSISPPSVLDVRRFLLTSPSTSSLIPPSTSSSIATILGHHQHYNDAASNLRFNRLQFLRCPDSNSVIVFYPTGPNSNEVGFMVISVKGSSLDVRVDEKGDIFTAKSGLNYQIFGIAVNPVLDSNVEFLTAAGDSPAAVGYLLTYSMYSVDWFVAKIGRSGSNSELVSLVYVCSKVFKSCSVVHVCWSPHLPEESLVLLESGSLFLFDLEPFLKTEARTSNVHIKGSRLRVAWDDSNVSKNQKWLSCEFSWHPQILIIARSDAVFLVDLRLDECRVSCLVKIEMFHMYASGENEQFLTFSKVGFDDFYFALASNSLLLLCDVRKPMMPVLQWTHGLDKPCYINVRRLSELRSHSRDDTYNWASESGFCIILGSFWSCEFGIFCYGPSLPAPDNSVASKVSQFYKSLYAWGLPSNLLLSGHGCPCGSCLMREESVKDALPEWIEWQQKKEIVLGFGILDKDLSALLHVEDKNGGFTLIRLTSSGKLESQRYCASWNSIKRLEESHRESMNLLNHLLYSHVDEDYRFPRKFRYLKLDYIMGYLNGNLTKVVDSNMKKSCTSPPIEEYFSLEHHEILCEKLKACGFGRFRSSPAITLVFNEISLPTSVHEVALRRLWADLPMELLQLAFSNYSESLGDQNKRLSLEFLTVPYLLQLPPFFLRNPSVHSNKWSRKIHLPDALLGPVLPLPLLLVLHEFHNGGSKLTQGEETEEFSSEAELRVQCDEVKRVAGEMAASHFSSDSYDDHVVSLADDREDMWVGSTRPKPFISYHPTAFKCFMRKNTHDDSICKAGIFDNLIFKVPERKLFSENNSENVGQEVLFDDLCPMELRSDAPSTKFDSDELKAYNVLKRQLLKWEASFDLYQEFLTPSFQNNK